MDEHRHLEEQHHHKHHHHLHYTRTEQFAAFMDRWWTAFVIVFGALFIVLAPFKHL